MNQENDGPVTSSEEKIHELVAEFHRLEDRGNAISPKDFISKHPEHADALKSYFDGVAAVDQMSDPPPAPEQTFVTGNTQAVADDQTIIEDSASVANNQRVSSDAPPTSFGRYKILSELGRGAMGAVYLAQDEQLDRKVALKIPQFGGALNSGLLERFYREARAAGNLRHPGICPVYDVGEIDGQHFITMAFIEGRPLRDFSKSSKRQADKQTARVIRKIAMAMGEAHDQNVIHRDLKPANIMIDTKNEPVVMDFGLARRAAENEEKLTHTGTVIGTPAYMSPEQVDGDNENVGPPADIYSLGVIFYELLTGELPFKGNLMSILKQISMKQPRPPVELHADVDPFLQNLCLKMLEKEAKDRPESMHEVAKTLSEWLQGLHAPTDESGVLETSRVPGQKRDKGPTLEVTDAMTTPGVPRIEPQPEEFPAIEEFPVVVDSEMSATTVTPSRSAASADKPPGNNKKLLSFGGLGGAAILLAGISFFINLGGKYDVKITVEDPAISLKVDGDDVLIDGAGSQIRLSAGTHTLSIERDGLEAELKEFTVTKDGKNLVHVAVVDGMLAVVERVKQTVEPDVPTSPGKLRPAVAGTNNAIQLTGKPSRVLTSTLRIPNDIDGLCVEGFVTFGDVNADQQVFGFPYEFIVGCGPRGLVLHYAHPDGRADLVPNFFPEEGGTYHIAAVFDGDSARLYVDGRMAGEREVSGGLAPNGRSLDVGFGTDAIFDEVRVSDTARYSEDFTPPNTSQQFQPDDHTLALYHCDEGQGDVLKDSSGNDHHGEIVGATWVNVGSKTESFTPAGDLYVLEFGGKSNSVELPELPIDATTPFTAEAWINLFPIENRKVGKGFRTFFTLDTPSRGSELVGRLLGDGSWTLIADTWTETKSDHISIANQTSKWTHVAMVCQGENLRLYLDGRHAGRGSRTRGDRTSQEYPTVFRLGARRLRNTSELGDFFTGQMRGFRLTRGVRYAENFVPSERFSNDEDTIAVYRFDEGQGDVLKDSSGNDHHGKIVGAKWVRVDGPGIDFADTPPIDLLRDPRSEISGYPSEKRADGSWRLHKGTLHFPHTISGDYRLDLGFKQEGGTHGEFKVLLPIGNSQVELVIPDEIYAKNRQNTELRLVDAVPLVVKSAQLHESKDQFLTIRVHQVGDQWHFTAALDDQKLLNRLFDEQQLSVPASAKASQAGVIKISVTGVQIDLKSAQLWSNFKLPDPAQAAPPAAIAPFDAAAAKAHQEAWAKHLGEPVETTNSVGMQLALIPPGKFKMGESDHIVDVTLTKPFRLGIHEVTQGQWKGIMETEPWKGKVASDANTAATSMNWTKSVDFCRKLTEQEKAAGKLRDGWEYRLPTCAEWDFACSAGTTTRFWFGDGDRSDEFGWFAHNARQVDEGYPHPVGLKKPNPWGLYDMHGNVWECCQNWDGALTGGIDPTGPDEGTQKICRGGSWYYEVLEGEIGGNFGTAPNSADTDQGFRVVLCPLPGVINGVMVGGASSAPVDAVSTNAN